MSDPRIQANLALIERLEISEELIDKHTIRKKVDKRGAAELLKLLKSRHSKDVFVSECKDGSTQSVSNYLRMDAWVMNRSWASPCVWVYEIKTSRSDFIADNKWPGYLPYCNQFYFVTPKDLIDSREIPEQAGLLIAIGQGNGARLITKKKAPYRDVVVPESVYRYILMCRVGVQPEYQKENEREYWREWMRQKDEDQKLGYGVSETIRKRASELEIENTRLKQTMKRYDDVRRTLTALGYPAGSTYLWDLDKRVQAAQKVIGDELIGTLTQVRRAVDEALRRAADIEMGYHMSEAELSFIRSDTNVDVGIENVD